MRRGEQKKQIFSYLSSATRRCLDLCSHWRGTRGTAHAPHAPKRGTRQTMLTPLLIINISSSPSSSIFPLPLFLGLTSLSPLPPDTSSSLSTCSSVRTGMPRRYPSLLNDAICSSLSLYLLHSYILILISLL